MPEGPTVSPAAEIARLVDEITRSGKGLSEEAITRITQQLAKLFSVKLDEIAILHLSENGTVLQFVYPFRLQKVGSIPMTTTNSLAVRTAREKRPEMVNNFTTQKHPTVFEAVSLDPQSSERHPIQKIMSVPLLLDGKPVGVVQVSRKGKSPTTAGNDFTIRDLTTLVTTAGVLAKCFKK